MFKTIDTLIDIFLALFRRDFSKPMSVAQARQAKGPHIYLVVTPSLHRYKNSYSHVRYIGVTSNPSRRFGRHHQLRRGDLLMLLPLKPYLRSIKKHYPNWSKTSSRQKRNTSETMERVFLYAFKRLLGSLPERNKRNDLPRSHQVAMLAEFMIQSRIKDLPLPLQDEFEMGTFDDAFCFVENEPALDLSTGKKIASALIREAPSGFKSTTDASGRRVLKHGSVHILRVRVCERHCRVQIRCYQACADGRFNRRQVTTNGWYDRWYQVDSQESLQIVINELEQEWTE